MDKQFVDCLVDYAKNASCDNCDWDSEEAEKKCLLKKIPYSFGESESNDKRDILEEEYHHHEDLCFLLMHVKDIDEFRSRLENAKLDIFGEL